MRRRVSPAYGHWHTPACHSRSPRDHQTTQHIIDVQTRPRPPGPPSTPSATTTFLQYGLPAHELEAAHASTSTNMRMTVWRHRLAGSRRCSAAITAIAAAADDLSWPFLLSGLKPRYSQLGSRGRRGSSRATHVLVCRMVGGCLSTQLSREYKKSPPQPSSRGRGW